MEIRAHRVGVDAAIALHGDNIVGLRRGLGRKRRKQPECRSQ